MPYMVKKLDVGSFVIAIAIVFAIEIVIYYFSRLSD